MMILQLTALGSLLFIGWFVFFLNCDGNSDLPTR